MIKSRDLEEVTKSRAEWDFILFTEEKRLNCFNQTWCCFRNEELDWLYFYSSAYRFDSKHTFSSAAGVWSFIPNIWRKKLFSIVPMQPQCWILFRYFKVLQGRDIFSEKSHQQGHDPFFNPLFSAIRCLNTAPPSVQRTHSHLVKCSNDNLSFQATHNPCKNDLIALSGQ